MGLATLLGRSQGFFIPYRYGAPEAFDYPRIEQGFAARIPAFAAHLAEIEARAGPLRRLGGPAPEPRFDQGWFPRSMPRRRTP